MNNHLLLKGLAPCPGEMNLVHIVEELQPLWLPCDVCILLEACPTNTVALSVQFEPAIHPVHFPMLPRRDSNSETRKLGVET